MEEETQLQRIEIENYFYQSMEDELTKDVLSGLSGSQKQLPSKYFYDKIGSRLFEKICYLPEYYVTRTEMDLLKNSAKAITNNFMGGDIIELGSGANWKIRTLLDQLSEEELKNTRYVPVDVSESALIEASNELVMLYPDLTIKGVIADFTKQLDILGSEDPKLIVFFGSSIGNFNDQERQEFLNEVASIMEPNDRFVLALDMIKPVDELENAYNDSQGVTSEFNKNILNVVNRELKADFDLEHFDHYAFFNKDQKRIEMHLKANQESKAKIKDLDMSVSFKKGETIHTEICRKFSTDCINKMAKDAGLTIDEWHLNPRTPFSLVELVLS